ncbi:MAG: hypothetical protein B7Y77_01650 [Bradyrhizobium sp. 35-63-5]|nr:MAG: hypothetical protein B7Y77_01650 [Bradyrhizobium sp. 35-63-5]
MSTKLYERTMAFEYGDAERSGLMHKVWSPTPWMIDVYVGQWEDGRERRILEWCYDTLGQESSPIHRHIGRWRRGNATICGWTWFGFAMEGDMQAFEAVWPVPADVEHPDCRPESDDAAADFIARRCERFVSDEVAR